MKSNLEKSYDGKIKQIRAVMGIEFTGTTFEDKRHFVEQHKPELARQIDVLLTSVYEEKGR